MIENDPSDDGHGAEISTGSAALEYEIGNHEKPSTAVIRAVSTVTETPILDLEPLYDSIDPDYLNEFFDGTTDAVESVAVRFGGCHLTVSRETVRVRTLEERREG